MDHLIFLGWGVGICMQPRKFFSCIVNVKKFLWKIYIFPMAREWTKIFVQYTKMNYHTKLHPNLFSSFRGKYFFQNFNDRRQVMVIAHMALGQMSYITDYQEQSKLTPTI